MRSDEISRGRPRARDDGRLLGDVPAAVAQLPRRGGLLRRGGHGPHRGDRHAALPQHCHQGRLRHRRGPVPFSVG